MHSVSTFSHYLSAAFAHTVPHFTPLFFPPSSFIFLVSVHSCAYPLFISNMKVFNVRHVVIDFTDDMEEWESRVNLYKGEDASWTSTLPLCSISATCQRNRDSGRKLPRAVSLLRLGMAIVGLIGMVLFAGAQMAGHTHSRKLTGSYICPNPNIPEVGMPHWEAIVLRKMWSREWDGNVAPVGERTKKRGGNLKPHFVPPSQRGQVMGGKHFFAPSTRRHHRPLATTMKSVHATSHSGS